MGILATESITVQTMYQITKDKSPGQLVLGSDMTLSINCVADWRYKHQRKQLQIEKYIIHKNSTRIDYNYRVGYKVMPKNKTSYKYETPFRGLYEMVQTWKNRRVTLQMGSVTTIKKSSYELI